MEYNLVKTLWEKMNTPVTGIAQILTVTGSAETLTVLYPEKVNLFYPRLEL